MHLTKPPALVYSPYGDFEQPHSERKEPCGGAYAHDGDAALFN
jgi:hypothetical protein